MKKRLIGTLAAAAVLAPALTLAGSGQAFAAGNPVTWNNKSTGEYLAYNNSRVRTVSASGYSTHWTEYRQSDGTYLMKFGGNGKCLDSNSNGDVYLLDCNGGHYQEWYEIHDSADGDWILKDKATGLVLDTGRTGTVYTDTEDDFQLAQRWS